jgi:hypothetical protein
VAEEFVPPIPIETVADEFLLPIPIGAAADPVAEDSASEQLVPLAPVASQAMPMAQPACQCQQCQQRRRGCEKRSLFGWWKFMRNRRKQSEAVERTFVPPAGSALQAMMGAQIANGQSARMVLHRYDFVPGEDGLTSRGKRQLSKIAALMLRNPSPLIVQTTREQPVLDQQRRRSVQAALATLSVEISPNRVVIGRSPARGLDGIDAEIIHSKLLQQTIGGGGGASSGGGSTGGTSGASSGIGGGR